jgi:hypothetical protein
MTRDQIIDTQIRIGTTPDGFWGPKSTASAQRHLRALMPNPNPWPTTDQASLTRFYGAAGDDSQLVAINVRGLGAMFDGKHVASIRCHRKVSESLLDIIQELSTMPEGRAVLAKYAGVYNPRNMRGGSLPSLHARGAAIDLDPASNRNLSHWPTRSTMPITVMEAFSRRGWLSAGVFWNRDSMHFQATQ